MSVKKIIASCALFIFIAPLYSQELKCNVTINSSQIQGTNKQVFTTLQTGLNDFMNNYKWTELIYAGNERIECNFMIIVKSYADDLFTTELQVQAKRPVYGTSYTTNLLNFNDQSFVFKYVEFDPVEINNNTFESNLTAVLAYYAYVILGLDLDSYSRLGGTDLFQMAEQIVTISQSRSQDAESVGWKAFENDRNRYALIKNLMDERFKKYREFFYEYHRLGLDNMSTNVENSRAKIAAGLPILRETYRENPGSIAILSFLDAKNDELINLFKKGTAKEKEEVYTILMDINPASGTKYDEIKK